MMLPAKVLTAVLAALVASGCSIGRYHYGSPLRDGSDKLLEGQSTRAEVLHLMGPPVQIVHQTNGDAFIYKYERQNTSVLQLRDPITGTTWFTYSRQFDRRDALVVFFDFTGIVRAVAIDRDVEDMPVL